MNSSSRATISSGLPSSHCQTVKTRHPAASSAARLAASLSRFAAIFGCQYSVRDLGRRPLVQPWPCQKQPCTNTATRYLGKTMSGVPGRSRRCSLNRIPAACAALRTASSGAVFFPPTFDMSRERASMLSLSAIDSPARRPSGGTLQEQTVGVQLSPDATRLQHPKMTCCASHSSGNPSISWASVTSGPCLPSRIASTMSGASSVRRRMRVR